MLRRVPRGLLPQRLTLLLAAELISSLLAMLLAAHLVAASPEVFLVVAGVSLLVRCWSGRRVLRPGLPRLDRVLRETTVPFLLAGLLVVAGAWTAEQLVAAAQVTTAAAGVALATALLRRWLPAAQRVVVVGSAVSVAEASTRWAGSGQVKLVGSLVVSDGTPRVPRPRGATPVPGEEVPTLRSEEIDPADLLRAKPDMVVLVPWPGMQAEQVRRIGWALEGTPAALAVQSELDGIAPHRLECTSYAGANLVHVASSRPARLPLLVKAACDRLLGLLLLLCAAPLLGVLMLAIRMDSAGPAIFRQERVGAGGRHFTMLKLRTMVVSAEAQKAALASADEGAGLLFKMADDPRVTRVGRVLRKLSLDELPQLVNVVRGDMSLVGPRPALPSEVERYSSLERRRLAAKPGLTGLWQVSGRSDLSWDDSVRLDNHYTENWRLTDDAVILLRTVDAVVRSRGAY